MSSPYIPRRTCELIGGCTPAPGDCHYCTPPAPEPPQHEEPTTVTTLPDPRRPSALDLYWLADHAHDIGQARLRGTARPWRQPAQLDATARHERDTAAASERADRTDLAIGEHPAPMHVDVADVVTDLIKTAADLSSRIAQAAGVDQLPPVSSAFADPTPYLRHAAAHLRGAAEADTDLGAIVEKQAARLRSIISVHLGELTTGQTLAALCPWCRGGIAGGFTLRVRTVNGDVSVVCESGTCEPPETDVGSWHRNHPAWPLSTEGEWLAARIEHADKGGPECRCGRPLLPTGAGGQQPRYCSGACRRAEYAERRRLEREAS